MHPVFITVSFAQSQSAPNAGVCCRDETRRANLFASLGHVSDASVFVSPSLSLSFPRSCLLRETFSSSITPNASGAKATFGKQASLIEA